MIRSVYFPLFACIALASVLLGMSGIESVVGDQQPVKVRAVIVREHPVSSRIEVVGTVQAVDQAVIASKIAGVIVEIPVVLGSRVKRDELLVRMNAEEISARVLQAQAQLAQATRNLKREEKLLAREASTQETVNSMRDMLAVAEAGYREATSMMAYTTISAPFSGVITRKLANTGDLATPGIPLLQMENPDRLQVVAAVPESLSLHIGREQSLAVIIPAGDATLQGTVAEISPVIDPKSRTSTIKINLEKATGLRTGMFARVRLPSEETSTLMVPESALVPFGQLEKIFVVNEERAQLRLVRTGIRLDGRVEILSGLRVGEQVVTTNNRHLVNGQPLQLEP